MKVALWTLGALLIVPTIGGQQQQQPPSEQQSAPDSVAEAARRAREQKKDQPKAKYVWTDDNLPSTPNYLSLTSKTAATKENSVASTDNAPSSPSSAGNDAATGTPAVADDEKNKIEAELATAKEHLQNLQTDLDLLQRTHTLDEQMYLGKPEHEKDAEGAAKMKEEEEQIAAKQQEVADAQKHLDELQAQLAKSSTVGSGPAPH